MTGVGAVFELWAHWQGNKKEEEPEEPKLEPDPDEEAEGYVDEDSEWHYVLEHENWDALLDMLQTYDYKLYKPKEPDKKKRLRVVGAAIRMKQWVFRPPEEEPTPISPLLALDAQGRTPVHRAVVQLAPDRYVIRMLFCEKKAALIPDKEGRLPLHLACIEDRNTPVIDRLIRSNFHHMQRPDEQGRTALWYAVEKAKERKEDIDGYENAQRMYWGIPRTQEEAEWQERQETIWSRVRFILLSYSTRRKIFVLEERDILLEALTHSAPPTVVEVSVLAAQGMLQSDPTLASLALRLFMKREYPIKNLQLLLHHFPDQKVESLEAARRLLTEHYHLGCRTLPGRSMTYRDEMEKHALEDDYKRSLPCQEWWKKIQCLLRLCGHQNDKKNRNSFENKHLLHAALSNSDTPPSLVQLLMVMHPEVIRDPHPFNNSLLVHLICRNWKYNLFPHSQKLGVELETEEPPMEQVLKIVLASDATLTRKRHCDRLPLHFAVATSKSMEFLDAIISKDRKSLSIRDPQTRLYPFQLAAVGNQNKNAALWAHAKYTPEEWKSLEPEERAQAVDDVLEEQDVSQLNTIYSLFRVLPSAVSENTLFHTAHSYRDTHGRGMVSAHYLVFLYERDEQEDFVLLKQNLAFFHEAIQAGSIPDAMEQWWTKLKFWIRYAYDGNEILPSEEEYLLHAAVANSDVPPLVVELLLAVYPGSASLPVNGETDHPLHIAAATAPYEQQPYETLETKNVLEMLMDAFPPAGTIQSASGLPMDIAQAQGHYSGEEIKPLVQAVARNIILEMEDVEEDIDLTGGGGTGAAPGLVEDSSVDDSQTTNSYDGPRH